MKQVFQGRRIKICVPHAEIPSGDYSSVETGNPPHHRQAGGLPTFRVAPLHPDRMLKRGGRPCFLPSYNP